MEDLTDNPFATLFPSLTVAKSYQLKQKSEEVENVEVKQSKPLDLSSIDVELNNSIEEIFLFTLNKFSVLGGDNKQLIYLSSLADIIGSYKSNIYFDVYDVLLHSIKNKSSLHAHRPYMKSFLTKDC